MPGRRKPNDPKGNLERNELDAAVQRIVEDIRRVYLTIGQELSSDILNDKVRRILDEEGGIMYRFIVTRLAEALGLKAVEETSQDDGDD